MTRWAASLAPLLACLGIAGAAEGRSPASGYSLVTGRVLDVREVGPPPCPQDSICMNWIYRFRISARTLSGTKVPSLLTAEIEVHVPPTREVHIVLLIRRGERGGPWIGTAVAAARPGETACMAAASLSEAGLPLPRGARRSADLVCFTV